MLYRLVFLNKKKICIIKKLCKLKQFRKHVKKMAGITLLYCFIITTIINWLAVTNFSF